MSSDSGSDEEWKCQDCGARYGSMPNVCEECGSKSFGRVSKKKNRWKCTNCGIEYSSKPDICPDCNESEFEEVVEEVVEPETDEETKRLLESASPGRFSGSNLYIIAILCVVILGIGFFAWIGNGVFWNKPCQNLDSPEDGLDTKYVECEVGKYINEKRSEEGYSNLSFKSSLMDNAREVAKSPRPADGDGDGNGFDTVRPGSNAALPDIECNTGVEPKILKLIGSDIAIDEGEIREDELVNILGSEFTEGFEKNVYGRRLSSIGVGVYYDLVGKDIYAAVIVC